MSGLKRSLQSKLGFIQVLPTANCASLSKESSPSKPVFLISKVENKNDGLYLKELLFKIYMFTEHLFHFLAQSKHLLAVFI